MLISKRPGFLVSRSIWNRKIRFLVHFLHIIAINLNYLVVFSLKTGKTGKNRSYQVKADLFESNLPCMVTIEHILSNKLAQKVDFWGCQMGLFIKYLLEAPLTNSSLARFPKCDKSITTSTCMRKTLHTVFKGASTWIFLSKACRVDFMGLNPA